MTATLLIGLDGATFDVLDPLVADGVMPALGRLMDDGVRARLLSTVNPLTAQAWPSLATGRGPGSHGLLDFVHFDASAQRPRFRIVTSRDLDCPTIWQLVSAAGQQVTVLKRKRPRPSLNRLDRFFWTTLSGNFPQAIDFSGAAFGRFELRRGYEFHAELGSFAC